MGRAFMVPGVLLAADMSVAKAGRRSANTLVAHGNADF
jgi:hypothetical protein